MSRIKTPGHFIYNECIVFLNDDYIEECYNDWAKKFIGENGNVKRKAKKHKCAYEVSS